MGETICCCRPPSRSSKVWAPGGDAVSVAGVMNMYVYSHLFPSLRQSEGELTDKQGSIYFNRWGKDVNLLYLKSRTVFTYKYI